MFLSFYLLYFPDLFMLKYSGWPVRPTPPISRCRIYYSAYRSPGRSSPTWGALDSHPSPIHVIHTLPSPASPPIPNPRDGPPSPPGGSHLTPSPQQTVILTTLHTVLLTTFCMMPLYPLTIPSTRWLLRPSTCYHLVPFTRCHLLPSTTALLPTLHTAPLNHSLNPGWRSVWLFMSVLWAASRALWRGRKTPDEIMWSRPSMVSFAWVQAEKYRFKILA